MPQYTTVDVASTAVFKAPAWNRTTGGILVFMANGAVTVEGTMATAAAGFRGADYQGLCFPGTPGCGSLLNGQYGESSLGCRPTRHLDQRPPMETGSTTARAAAALYGRTARRAAAAATAQGRRERRR